MSNKYILEKTNMLKTRNPEVNGGKFDKRLVCHPGGRHAQKMNI